MATPRRLLGAAGSSRLPCTLHAEYYAGHTYQLRTAVLLSWNALAYGNGWASWEARSGPPRCTTHHVNQGHARPSYVNPVMHNTLPKSVTNVTGGRHHWSHTVTVRAAQVIYEATDRTCWSPFAGIYTGFDSRHAKGGIPPKAKPANRSTDFASPPHCHRATLVAQRLGLLYVDGVKAKDNLAAQLVLQVRWLGAGCSAARICTCTLLAAT